MKQLWSQTFKYAVGVALLSVVGMPDWAHAAPVPVEIGCGVGGTNPPIQKTVVRVKGDMTAESFSVAPKNDVHLVGRTWAVDGAPSNDPNSAASVTWGNFAGGGTTNTLTYSPKSTAPSGEFIASINFTYYCGSPLANPPAAAMQTRSVFWKVSAVEILRIELENGGVELSPGLNAPVQTNFTAAVKSTGDINLKAIINPAVPEADLPTGFVSWAGGQAVAGLQLKRTVAKTTAAKFLLLLLLETARLK